MSDREPDDLREDADDPRPQHDVGPENDTGPQNDVGPQHDAGPEGDVVPEEPAHDPVVDVRVRRALDVRRVLVSATSAVCVLGLTAGVVLADERLPRAEVTAVDARVIEVPPAPTALVCPGPLHVPTEVDDGDDVAYDPQFDTTPAESDATLAAFLTGTVAGVLARGAEGDDGDLPVPAGAVRTVTDPGSMTLRVPGEADPSTAAATVMTRTEAGDLRGATAAPCAAPAAEHWLVGGSTALGSGARLVLQNPGRTAATVRVDVWGPAGPLDVSGAPEFLVPPGQERVVLLEGVAAEQRRIVVRTTADGGLVHAYLQDSELRGLVPAGVALVTAGAPPSTEQVVSGIDVEASEPGGADTAVLRLLAPGGTGEDDDAEGPEGEVGANIDVEVQILGADGPVDLPGVGEVSLVAGEVLDVPLGGLPAGAHAAVVRAEVPVAAAAMITRGASVGSVEASVVDPLDRAWLPGQVTVADGGAPGALAVPPVIPRHLVLATPGASATTAVVRAWDADGTLTETDVMIPGRSTVRLGIGGLGDPTPQVVEVIGDDVVWSVTLLDSADDGDHVAALTPPARAPRQDRIVVDIR